LRGEGHHSDQSKVWAEVTRLMDSLGTSSGTFAMSDTFDSYGDRLAEFRNRLNYVEGATGLAVAVGDQVVAIDLFDQPSTCRKAWSRLLSGVVMDALEAGKTSKTAAPGDVEALLRRLRAADWQPAPAVGEGEEYRSDPGEKLHASALLFAGAVVHGSAVVAV
jgi:hypothetical protein